MKIIKKDSDKLNSIISISLEQNDFADKVLKILKDYQKKANIPGFRKGHVPMGLVKKQYENAVTADEVNKLLQEKLSSYIEDEKIEILGNPLPKLKKELDWKSPEITFEFEIGLAPNFDLNLKSKKKVTYYKIEADPKMITNQVEYLQKQYGKLIPKTEIKNNEQITIEFDVKENQINKSATIELKEIKSTKIIKLLKSSKVGDKIQIQK
jgi:trigger factor